MRQYIGARYTTKVYQNSQDPNSCEWENVEFEPLTIVSFQNSSYLSRTEVPANVGNPTVATQYWAQTGFYNGQIAQLQNDVADLYTKFDLVARKALYLGNSYTTGYGSTGNNKGLFALTNGLFKDADYVATSGAGFLTYTDHTSTFVTQLSSWLSNPTIPKDEITDLIITSAWGDTIALQERGTATFETDLESNIDAIKTLVHNNLPNCKRIIVSYGDTRGTRNSSVGGSINTSYYNMPFRCYQIMKRVCQRKSVDFLGWVGWQAFMTSGMISSDNQHPNDNGYASIAGAWIAAYFGNMEQVEKRRSLTCNFKTMIASGSNCEVEVSITPERSTIVLEKVNIAAGASASAFTSGEIINFSEQASNIVVPPNAFEINSSYGSYLLIPGGDMLKTIPILFTRGTATTGELLIGGTNYVSAGTLSELNNSPIVGSLFTIPHV